MNPLGAALPAGYEQVEVEGAYGFCTPAAVPWLRETLEADRIHEWASAQPSLRELQGRGRVFSVPAPVLGPDRRKRWVVRHYLRGGAVASWLGDRYLHLGRPRPLLETLASAVARSRNVPTPAVIAGVVYPAGIFYRADLVTEEIPDATDLAEVLFGANPAAVSPENALRLTGRLVRSLERAGVLHRDLNAKNIVLEASGAELRAHLVDLDHCAARDSGVPAPAFPMRRRLERSLRKFGRNVGPPLSSAKWAALRAGYEGAA